MKLYGKRSVMERVRVNPQTIKRIFVEKGFSDQEIPALARKKKISVEVVDVRRFYKMTRGFNSQGITADIEDYQYDEIDDYLDVADKDKPVLVFLDGLTDPQNLGSIIRTLACVGGFCVVLPRRDSAGITEAVLRVANGGENYVPIIQVVNLSNTLQKVKSRGYLIGTTTMDSGKNPRHTLLKFPFGIILGSEGSGIRPILEKYVDYKLTIPMKGSKLSYNVAIATAILSYEIACQRDSV
jgi:23S rRNA (guanosine2251-2'-O)-methyltransferase